MPIVIRSPLMELNNQVHVLCHRVAAETSGFDDRRAVEDGERPRHDERPAQQMPARTAEQETAQVFDHLKSFQPGLRQAYPYHAPVLGFAAVQYAHDPAAHHGVNGGIDDRVHQPQQGIAFEQAIGVQVAEVG